MSPVPYRVHNGHLCFPEVAVVPENTVIHGDCIPTLAALPDNCIDFVLIDPPCGYRVRNGRTIANDRRADWLEPAFREIYRVMKPDTLCTCFCHFPPRLSGEDRFPGHFHKPTCSRVCGALIPKIWRKLRVQINWV